MMRLSAFRVWLLSAIGLLLFTGGVVLGQAGQKLPPPRVEMATMVFPDGTVISGENIGFRVQRTIGGRPVGRLVLKAGSDWVEADIAPR
jgi:hypothetical protein